MNKVNDNNKLAIQMLIAMVSGILVGLLFMAVRQFLGAESAAWSMINNILFQDITASGAEIYYTTDGSDPRYSATRAKYSAAFANAGVVKAVAYANGKFVSDVAEK